MSRSKQLQAWKAGDCFIMPLLDGRLLLCQILAAEPDALNSVSCALFDQKVASGDDITPDLARLFSTVLTTRDLLDSGRWKVIGASAIEVPREQFPFESLRGSRFIGAKVIGSQIIEEFANAFCGLALWDNWADPHYLDRLLISPDVKPTHLRYKGE